MAVLGPSVRQLRSTIEIIRGVAFSFGYPVLKKEQEQAILSFVTGEDVFVSLPTGYGKSLCFALLPSVFDQIKGVDKKSVVIVVSPLIALMKDQVSTFQPKGFQLHM